jgi:hypothetical protein
MRAGLNAERFTGFTAAFAHKAIRPADRLKVGGASEVIGKEFLELR